jgi:hypothetical protein
MQSISNPAVNALDFPRSQPQVAAMNQIRTFLPQQRAATPAPALPSKAAKTKTPDTDSLVYKKDHGDVEVLPRSLHAQAPGSNMRRFSSAFVGYLLQAAAPAPPLTVAKTQTAYYGSPEFKDTIQHMYGPGDANSLPPSSSHPSSW